LRAIDDVDVEVYIAGCCTLIEPSAVQKDFDRASTVIADGVPTSPARENIAENVIATMEIVIAGAAIESITEASAIELVIAIPAFERIGAFAAFYRIITLIAADAVMAIIALEIVMVAGTGIAVGTVATIPREETAIIGNPSVINLAADGSRSSLVCPGDRETTVIVNNDAWGDGTPGQILDDEL
jgi:hypothetical protein